jgi:penicillin-insensitive murein endopeptidase
MLTPIDAIAALCLVMSPAWGNPASPFVSQPSVFEAAFALKHDDPVSLLSLSDEELLRRLETDPGSVGPLSIGAPGSGLLFNAVALPPGPQWDVLPSADSWATAETVSSLQVAVEAVRDLYPGTAPLAVGDLSDIDGGRLKRHETHQAGRDVDVGFYFKTGATPWFVVGTAANLDLPRNWALVRALVVHTDIETILLDTRIQRLLYKYALGIGEDRDWLDRVFQCSRWSPEAIVKHVPRHRNHYHVRFYNPVAQELGRRAHPLLVRLNVLAPPTRTVRHVVRSGQTLGHLAARYGTSIRAIQAANGMTGTQLRAGRAYRIPVKAPVPPPAPVVVPARLLPPSTPAALTGIDWPVAAPPDAADGDRHHPPAAR